MKLSCWIQQIKQLEHHETKVRGILFSTESCFNLQASNYSSVVMMEILRHLTCESLTVQLLLPGSLKQNWPIRLQGTDTKFQQKSFEPISSGWKLIGSQTILVGIHFSCPVIWLVNFVYVTPIIVVICKNCSSFDWLPKTNSQSETFYLPLIWIFYITVCMQQYFITKSCYLRLEVHAWSFSCS